MKYVAIKCVYDYRYEPYQKRVATSEMLDNKESAQAWLEKELRFHPNIQPNFDMPGAPMRVYTGIIALDEEKSENLCLLFHIL